jgi:hypothetical protein
VERGKLDAERLVPIIANCSFTISTSLLYGNILLMYMSKSVPYALLSALTSVFTEILGKLYAVWVTLKSRQLKQKIKKKIIGREVEVDEGDEGDIDEKLTDMYWENMLFMFAVRWHNEIVSEKCCILVCAFTTKALINSPHSGANQVLVTLIFIGAEVIADGMLVYCLDKYWQVPFLRLPREKNRWSKEQMTEQLKISFVVASGTFMIVHAIGSVYEWFPPADNLPLDGANTTAGAVIEESIVN